MTNSIHHDDLNVSITKPKLEDVAVFPWSQGLNIVSGIFNFSALSAFNGYPIDQTDNPFTIILPSQKKGNIAWFNTKTQKWQILTKPVVFNGTTIATTTNSFGLFAVTNQIQTQDYQSKTETKPEPQIQPQPVVIPQVIPKPKTCFMWWCW